MQNERMAGKMMQNSGAKKRKFVLSKKWTFYTLMMALPLLQFVIFYILVNFNSILMAFQTYNKLDGFRFDSTLTNFRRFFSEFRNGTLISGGIRNSLIYLASSVVITIPLTLLFAYYIYKKFHFAEFYKVMLFLPGVISAMIFVMFFKYFIDYSGVEILQKLTGNDRVTSPLNQANPNFWLLLGFNIWIGFSSTILLYVNAMTQVSPSVTEAATIDGASELRIFWSVILPSIWPTLVSFIVITVAGVASNQANLYSFFGRNVAPDIQTLGYYQFMLVWANNNMIDDYPYASAVGLFFTLIVAPLTIIVRNLLTKYGPRDD